MLDGSLPNVRPNTKYEKTQKRPCLPPLLGKGPGASQAPSLGLEGQQERGEEGTLWFPPLSFSSCWRPSPQIISQSHDKKIALNNILLSTYYIPGIN